MDNSVLGKEISVIIPVYNEVGVIEQVVRNFYEKVVKKIPDTTFIIAEDGSTDGTKDILRKLNKEIPFVLISGSERKGYTKTFKDTLNIAKTELVFFSDSDGQHEPEDFFKLLKEIDENDIVSGYKLPRRDPLYRTVFSKAYNLLIYLLFSLKMKDIDSGFKLIKKRVIDNVLNDITVFKYCVMSEFILRACLAGYRIKEIPVSHYPRKSGKTTIFRPKKLPSIIPGLIKNLFEIRFSYFKKSKK